MSDLFGLLQRRRWRLILRWQNAGIWLWKQLPSVKTCIGSTKRSRKTGFNFAELVSKHLVIIWNGDNSKVTQCFVNDAIPSMFLLKNGFCKGPRKGISRYGGIWNPARLDRTDTDLMFHYQSDFVHHGCSVFLLHGLRWFVVLRHQTS